MHNLTLYDLLPVSVQQILLDIMNFFSEMLVLVSWESIVYADNYVLVLVCVCLLYTEAAFSQSACLLARVPVECVNIFTVNVGCD